MKTARYLLLILLSLFLLWKSFDEIHTKAVPVDDFVAYWAAARLQIQGQNPYSPALIMELERSAGSKEQEPLVMLNPPWTLAFLMPFGMVDYPVGRIAWLLAGLFTSVLGAWWAWQVYGGSSNTVGVAGLITFSFLPLWIVLVLGQITPFILAGMAGFLYFEQRSMPLLAGVCLVPLTFKPHLFYLFWFALLLWVLQKRLWKICAGAAIGWLATMALTAIFNPAVCAQYLDLTRNQPPALHWRTPTIGTLLRTIVGMEHTWLQFIPMIAGTSWLLYQWRLQRYKWDCIDQMPFLVLVSLTTTSYVWFYDQMLFLPAILQVAVTSLEHRRSNPKRLGLVVFAALNLILVIFVFLKLPPLHYLWSFSAWLIWYCCFVERKQEPLDSQSALLKTV